MSWSGPVAGSAPHQPPPYSQPGYGQQNYQYGQNPGYGQYQPGSTFPSASPSQPPTDNRPPKKKGNPIITRYPPPPGYRGPAQTQPPFGANQYPNQYQSHHAGYPQAPQPHPAYHGQYSNQGYSPQNFGPPQSPNYPAPPYANGHSYQWPQQGFQSSQTYPQTSFRSGSQGYVPPQNSQQHYPPQQGPVDPRQQAFQGAGWSQHNAQSYPSTSQPIANNGLLGSDRPMSDPNATPTQATVPPVPAASAMASSKPTGSQRDQNPSEKPKLFLGWDDWDFDFEGAIWPKSSESVDPSLSLGVIVWHPAKQVTRALPSTFAEAEEQALKPIPEKLGNGESVSIYFTAENSHEAFLNIRQMEEWDMIKDDPVFVIFTDEDMSQHLVTLEDCIAQRDRPDELVASTKKDEDEVMDEIDWSVMDNLEQALSTGGKEAKHEPTDREPRTLHNQTQEDILAMLGVTGSPKPPPDEHQSFPTSTTDGNPPVSLPGKSLAPHPSASSRSHLPQRALSMGGPHNVNHRISPRPYSSMSSASTSKPPPPPPPSEQQRYGPWNTNSKETRHSNSGFGGTHSSPALSERSNGTMAGSDFGSEKPAGGDHEASNPAPHLHRSDSSFSRKRGYEDIDQDDHTKRKRRSLVDAAYSRR